MNPGSILRRTAASTLRVLAVCLLVGAAKAAPPESVITMIPAAGPITNPAPTAPPSTDDARRLQDAGKWNDAAHAWHAIVEANPKNGTAWFNLGYCLHAGGHLEKAIDAHRKAATFEEFKGIALYNLGCAYALTNRPDRAFAALAGAEAAGFPLKGRIEGDSDLDSLRDDPRFAALLGQRVRGRVETHRDAHDGGHDEGHEDAHDDGHDEWHDSAHGDAHAGASGHDDAGGDWSNDWIEDEHNDWRGGRGDLHQFIAGIREFIEYQMPQIQQHLMMMAERAMEHAHHVLSQIEEHLANDEQFAAMAEKIGQWMGGGRGGGGMMNERPPSDRRHGGAPAIELPPEDEPFGLAPRGRGDEDARDDFAALLEKGRRLQEREEYDEAIAVFDIATEMAPDEPAAWFGRAYCLHMSGRYEEAIGAHRKAAKFEAIRGISLYNLACAYALTGKLDDAMMALRESRRAGFDLAEPIRGDSDLDNLRDDARFKKLLSDLGVDY